MRGPSSGGRVPRAIPGESDESIAIPPGFGPDSRLWTAGEGVRSGAGQGADRPPSQISGISWNFFSTPYPVYI